MEQLPKYGPTTQYFVRFAEIDFFPHIDEDTRERIEVVFRSMCWLDAYLDILPEAQKKQLVQNVFRFLNGDDTCSFDSPQVANSLHDLRNKLDSGLPENKAQFLRVAKEIMELSGKLPLAATAREIVDIRVKEGTYSADLILLLAHRLAENPKFVKFSQQLGAVGELTDCIQDAWDDKRRGEISVPPLRVFLRAATELLKHGEDLSREHPNKMRFFMLAAGWGIRHLSRAHHPKHDVCQNGVATINRRNNVIDGSRRGIEKVKRWVPGWR